MEELGYDKDYANWLALGKEIEDTHFASAIAELTINWGRLEYYLYLILHSIDQTRGAEWTQIYFQTNALERRILSATKEILAATAESYPSFADHLSDALAEFRKIRPDRNAIAHGLWKRVSSRLFVVHPMRLAKDTGQLELPFEVDLAYVPRLCVELNKVLQRFATLVTEMLALRYLEKRK